MDKRRFFYCLLCFSVIIIVFIGKLLWVQVIAAHHYSTANVDLVRNSVEQREWGIVSDIGRGQFYDQHMQPMTGERVQAMAVYPVKDRFRGIEEAEQSLLQLLHISASVWHSRVDHQTVPILWQSAKIQNSADKPMSVSPSMSAQIDRLHIPGIKVIPYTMRYSDHTSARQLIGYIGENPQSILTQYKVDLEQGKLDIYSQIGASGLEKSLDPILRGIGKTSYSVFLDASKHRLTGLDVRTISPNNPYYPLKVITTLDLPIQQKIEAFLDHNNFKEGAVVVLDASNADVVAMASRPQFSQGHVIPDQGDWANRAVRAMAPGSIFKTVIAAAALEENKVRLNEKFYCSGELGKYGLSCWKKGGHGKITFAEAYADSCNVTFAKVAQRLTADQVELYAKKLGLDTKVGWSGPIPYAQKSITQFDHEEQGQLFAQGTNRHDGGVLAQTAIGQRDVLMTPLQGANLIVTLLHHGKVMSPRAVKEIRYQNNQMLDALQPKSLTDGLAGISNSTAIKLLQLMKVVVEEGTGRALQHAKWKLAGKSGTAQISYHSVPAVNQWFIGYGPVRAPRYAVSVVIENVAEAAPNQVLAIFRGIMDILAANSNQ